MCVRHNCGGEVIGSLFICWIICDSLQPRACSIPSFPVLHYLLELAQTHVHGVGGAVQPSHLSPPSPVAFPSLRVFFNELTFHRKGQSVGASASVLPFNIRDWFPLGWTGLISLQSKGFSSLQHQSLKASILWHSAFFMVQFSNDYWKNHSLSSVCWQAKWCLSFCIHCPGLS